MERTDTAGRWGRLKAFLIVAVLLFTMTLAVIVGTRLSDEALAVLAGAVVGVAAAIPTSLLIVTVVRRRDEGRGRTMAMPQQQQAQAPPVIVVTPQNGQPGMGSWRDMPPSLTMPQQRRFTVVGADSTAEME
jgi:hypothetical protein